MVIYLTTIINYKLTLGSSIQKERLGRLIYGGIGCPATITGCHGNVSAMPLNALYSEISNLKYTILMQLLHIKSISVHIPQEIAEDVHSQQFKSRLKSTG